jgi:hypothetical protein
MFQDAPIILPYARIVGAMKTKPATANANGFCDGSSSGTKKKYAAMEAVNNPTNVLTLLNNNRIILVLPKPIRLPTSCPLSDSQGDITIGTRTRIPINKIFGK